MINSGRFLTGARVIVIASLPQHLQDLVGDIGSNVMVGPYDIGGLPTLMILYERHCLDIA